MILLLQRSKFGPWLFGAILLLCACCGHAQTPMNGSATISGFGEFDSGPGIIPPTLFGLHFSLTRNVGSGYTGIPWPNISGTNLVFGSLRLWDANTNWTLMNQTAGNYNFASLDSYLAAAKTNGLSDVVLTLSSTPTFISSDPTNANCDYGSASGLTFQEASPTTLNGSCGAPTDIATNGTGTDATWKSFITNLGQHIAGLSTTTYATVSWFEMWNEFTRGNTGSCGEVEIPTSWEGTCAQLVRMANDADCILTGRGTIAATGAPCTNLALLPNALMLTPDAVPQQPDIVSFGTYIGTLGALYGLSGSEVDGIAVHAYAYSGLGTTMPDSSAAFSNTGSSLPAQWGNLQGVLPGNAFGLPVWSTEGSWASAANLPDPDMMMGYIARYYLVGWSSGFRRLYWYSANNSYGRLIWQNGETETSATSPYGAAGTCGTTAGCPVLNSAGTPVANAWIAVYTWMVGNEMTTGCSPDATGNLWQCGLVTGGSTPAIAVWDSSQSCNSGTCTSSGLATAQTVTFVAAVGGTAQAIAASASWVTAGATVGGYASFVGSGAPSGTFLVTGITTTTTTNDTLLLADPKSLIGAASSVSVEAFAPLNLGVAPGSFGHYETLDNTPTLHALTGTVTIGWKPILLVP